MSSHYVLAEACTEVRRFFNQWEPEDVEVVIGIDDPKKGRIPEVANGKGHKDGREAEPDERLYAEGRFDMDEVITLTTLKASLPAWPPATTEAVLEPDSPAGSAAEGVRDRKRARILEHGSLA